MTQQEQYDIPDYLKYNDPNWICCNCHAKGTIHAQGKEHDRNGNLAYAGAIKCSSCGMVGLSCPGAFGVSGYSGSSGISA